MRKRTIWRLSITPERKDRAAKIAQEMRRKTGQLITDPEAVGILIDETFRELGLRDDEPAAVTAGAGENE